MAPSYDPEEQGAECGRCPLRAKREGLPVAPEWPANPVALVIGANPGPEEVKRGQPFVGASGIEFMRGLASIGVRRDHCAITNAVLCCPPGAPRGALERFNHWVQKENKARAAKGQEAILYPMEACRPRLLGEIAALSNVITMGGAALHAVTGRPIGVMEARGGPRDGLIPRMVGEEPLHVRLLPALHPSFVMSSRRWRGAFRADLARAFRWFTSGLAWKEPLILYRPTPKALRGFLARIRLDPFSVFDVETFPGFREADHYDPMFDRLKCIGIGVASGLATIVPFRSIESEGAQFYTRADQNEIVEILRDYFTNPAWKKAGWNSRYYDRQVIEAQLGVIPFPHLDGIGLSRLAEPELPHNLGFAGSIYTDVDKWKQGHVAVEAASDRQLWDYNAKDCVVTAMAIPALAKVVRARKQEHLLPVFARLQDICVGLHRNGLYVNQEIRREWDRKLLWQAAAHRKKIRDLAGRADLNPASFPQIADLLFEKLDITPHHYTALGDPSTDDDALRAFLSETWGLDPKRKLLVSAVRDFRRVTKRRGLVVRLRPLSEPYYEEPFLVDLDETEDEKEERERRQKKGKARSPGLVHPDGRVHGDWNAQGTTGWRFSSSSPNCQNFEDRLRDMIEPAPGHVFVGCDEAQLELRMVAGLAGCAYYLEAFEKGDDPHKALCIDTFGRSFLDADKDQQKRLRRSVKELTYSSLYWAGNETKLEIVTSAEDENEELIFPDFELREVAAFTDAWHRRCPEISAWWESILAEWKRLHYLAEPILGLKCDFLDGEEREKLVNYKPQSGGAGLVHLALFKALSELPFEKWGPGTGLVQQGHDSLVFEVPESEGERVAKILEEAMRADGRQWGLAVPFMGEAKTGRNWKQV